MGLAEHAMVTSPTGKGVIVMGGETNSYERSKAMFELSQSMEWTRLDQTLQIEHSIPLAIPIPDELVLNNNFLVHFLLLDFTKSSICLK